MPKNRFAMLEGIATQEIAAEVDARIPYRGFHYRCWALARKGAFSCFVFQCLLLLCLHFKWIVFIVLSVAIVEDFTNRFTIKTYSTEAIVALIMKRSSSEKSRFRYMNLALISAAVCCFSVVAGQLGTPPYRCHIYFFAATALMLLFFKRWDRLRNPRGGRLVYMAAGVNRFHVEVSSHFAKAGFRFTQPWYGLLGADIFKYLAYYILSILVILLFLAIALIGGVNYQNSTSQLFIIVAAMFSVVGCTFHELSRFYLVEMKMGQLNAMKSRFSCGNDAEKKENE